MLSPRQAIRDDADDFAEADPTNDGLPEPKPPPGVRVDPRRHKVVCKHWLRGLCKKGDDCDFLHQLDRDRMPECWFFSNFGECSNKDCIFLHIRPEDKVSTGLRQVPLSSSPRGSHRPK